MNLHVKVYVSQSCHDMIMNAFICKSCLTFAYSFMLLMQLYMKLSMLYELLYDTINHTMFFLHYVHSLFQYYMYIMKYYLKSPPLFVFFQCLSRDAFKCIVNIDCVKLDCGMESHGIKMDCGGDSRG